jgi:MFS family permease
MPSVAVFRSYGLRIVLLSLVFGFQQMDGIISGTYMISFMNLAGVPLTTTASLLVIGRLGDAAGIVISGPCADFLNRKAVAYGAIALTTALSYPFVMAVLSRQVVAIAVLQFLITFLGVGILHGLAPILTSESFPTKYRYSGAGLAFNLSAIVGGMMPPSILAGLIGQDAKGKWYYVILVYAIYCVVSMVALAFIPETRDIRLEELDD